MSKKMQKPLPQPDVIAAVRVIRKVREVIERCRLKSRIHKPGPPPDACPNCVEGYYCLECRTCREEIIREVARVLKFS